MEEKRAAVLQHICPPAACPPAPKSPIRAQFLCRFADPSLGGGLFGSADHIWGANRISWWWHGAAGRIRPWPDPIAIRSFGAEWSWVCRQDQLSSLLDAVEAGQAVVITRRGKPIAELVPR